MTSHATSIGVRRYSGSPGPRTEPMRCPPRRALDVTGAGRCRAPETHRRAEASGARRFMSVVPAPVRRCA